MLLLSCSVSLYSRSKMSAAAAVHPDADKKVVGKPPPLPEPEHTTSCIWVLLIIALVITVAYAALVTLTLARCVCTPNPVVSMDCSNEMVMALQNALHEAIHLGHVWEKETVLSFYVAMTAVLGLSFGKRGLLLLLLLAGLIFMVQPSPHQSTSSTDSPLSLVPTSTPNLSPTSSPLSPPPITTPTIPVNPHKKEEKVT